MTGSFKQGGQPQNGTPLNLAKTGIATEQRLGLGGDAFTVLYGTWKGKVGKFETVLRFTLNGMQQVAFLDVIEQKATVPVTSASATGKKVVLKVAALGGEFSGDLTGKTLTGQWVQGGQTFPVTWTKQ
jgi:hypothetical protein